MQTLHFWEYRELLGMQKRTNDFISKVWMEGQRDKEERRTNALDKTLKITRLISRHQYYRIIDTD